MKQLIGKNENNLDGVKAHRIALGGGCHWCTEAVFQSLIGVEKVEQGHVASIGVNNTFSEAVIVHFNPEDISLKKLIEAHLYTHKSTSLHSMRKKYRSAVYTFSQKQKEDAVSILDEFQKEFDNKIITQVYTFSEFKESRMEFQDYYQKNPNKPFCQIFINPKLKLLSNKFAKHFKQESILL